MITSIRIKNFKAIKDSGEIKLSPFTAIIGRNGSGKSSLIEGIEFLHDLINSNLETAIQRWKNYERIIYNGEREEIEIDKESLVFGQMETKDYEKYSEDLENYEIDPELEEYFSTLADNFEIDEESRSVYLERDKESKSINDGIYFKVTTEQSLLKAISQIFITKKSRRIPLVSWENLEVFEYQAGVKEYARKNDKVFEPKKILRKDYPIFKSMFSISKLNGYIKELKKLQFLNINHFQIGDPLFKPIAKEIRKLNRDASNLFNYISWISRKRKELFTAIKRDFKEIIKYTRNLREHTVPVQMKAEF